MLERLRSSLGSGHDTNRHVKKVRQYFILCQLLYCTNPKQPTPIHNLLADVVEVCGGSRQLLQILNRLGCVSSPDTHDRFVAQHAEARRQKSIWDELPMFLQLAQLTTLTCYKAIQLCTVVISSAVSMAPHYSLYNQGLT